MATTEIRLESTGEAAKADSRRATGESDLTESSIDTNIGLKKL